MSHKSCLPLFRNWWVFLWCLCLSLSLRFYLYAVCILLLRHLLFLKGKPVVETLYKMAAEAAAAPRADGNGGSAQFPHMVQESMYIFETERGASEYYRRGWRHLSENWVRA